ncbi:dihydrofolate reductase [Prauserella sediminis]|uniref:Dihydrofolate reductase n=1 Tax=Prauserella sediminis TaxID=577680 RepID=A0A839Y1M8_9PSEU|nr:dihydrofolate reductase family protein [Prauserella sediminis]MBB3666226.1 dihydrofolate reductase [Prauserella sediminis]
MQPLFLHTNVSLDGFICDTAGHIDWHFSDEEFQQYLDGLLESIDGMVFGRVAYEQLAAYWPTAGDEVSIVQRSRMRELPKYVLSRTLTAADWYNTHLLGEEPLTEIRRLTMQPGRGIAVFAGGSAATSLLEAELLAEVRLVLNPILIGGGTRLFAGSYPISTWRLTSNRPFASGATVLTYERRTR